jgi:ribosomal protein S18 acetylase RimI-like enzyme
MEVQRFTYTADKETPFVQEYFALVKENFVNIPWIKSIENFHPEVFLLVQEGVLVGGVAFFDRYPEESDVVEFKNENLKDTNIFISTLFIKEDSRSQGLGEKLLKNVFDTFSDKYDCAWGIVENNAVSLIDYYKRNYEVSLYKFDDSISLIVFKTK